jgi:Ca-activated chloride channel homolog
MQLLSTIGKALMKKMAIKIAGIMLLIAACVQMSAQTPDSAPVPSNQPAAESVVIPSGQIFIMQLDTALHTHTTKKGDKVKFHTAADVVLDNQIVIPNQSLIRAVVSKCKRAGIAHGRAELQLRFETIKLGNGKEIPIQATVTRAGFDPVDGKTGEDVKVKGEKGSGIDSDEVIKGAAQGAIVGVIFGGLGGAAKGSAAGGAVPVVGGLLKRGPDIDFPRSTMFEARFDKPVELPRELVQAQNAPQSPRSLPKKELKTERGSSGDLAIIQDTEQADPNIQQKDRPVLKRHKSEDARDVESETPQIASNTTPVPAVLKPAPAPPPDVDPSEAVTISVKVKMVQVDTVVRDRSGRLMDSLKQGDFKIYEDGVLQEIAGFSQDALPLSVALVVDRSESEAPYIDELRRIAVQALNALKPKDEVCLFSFAADVARLEELTSDRQRIASALDRIRAGGSTNIMDALHDAIKYLAMAAPDSRRAIILISDNEQTEHPRFSDHEVVNFAQERDTVIYSLKTGADFNLLSITNTLSSLVSGNNAVKKVAQETGGELMEVSHITSLSSSLRSVISRLRSRYSLGYYPSSANQGGAFHSITIRLDDQFGKQGNDYFVHAKRGYYSTSATNRSASVDQFK